MQIGSLTIEMAANIARLQRDMESSRKIVGGAAMGMQRSFDLAGQAMSAMASGSAQSIRAAQARLEAIDKAAASAAVASDRLANSVGRVGTMAAGLIGLQQIERFVGGAIQMADQFTTMDGRLRLVTTSSEQAAAQQAKLFAVAQEARADLGTTVELYSKLAMNTEGLGLSQDRLIGLTRTIGQTMAISGGEAAGMNAALVQFAQGLAAGTLRGDELNSVIEQTPALAQAIATGMGHTTGELKALGEAGAITAGQVVNALENMAASVEADFAKIPATVGQAMTQMNNAVLQSVGIFDQQNGLSRELAGGISYLAQNMDTLVGSVGVLAGAMSGRLAGAAVEAIAASIAARTARIAEAQATFAQTEAELAHTAAQAASARAAAQTAAVYGMATAQKAAATAAESAHTAAVEANAIAQAGLARATAVTTGALGLLGGPIGIITMLLGVGVSAWMAWGGSSAAAAAQASNAMGAASDNIVGDLDRQIAKLKDRNRLAQLDPKIGNAATPAVDKLAGIKATIDQLKAGTGIAAQMGQAQRAANLAGYSLQYEELAGKIKTFNAEQETANKLSAAAAASGAKARKPVGGGGGRGAAASTRAVAGAQQEWVKALEDFRRIADDVEKKQASLTAGQSRLLDFLKSPVYAKATEQQRQNVLQQAYATIAAEQAAAAQEQLTKAKEDQLKALRDSQQSAADDVARMLEEAEAARLAATQNMSLAQATEMLRIARLQEQAAKMAGNTDAVSIIQSEIDKRRELVALIGEKDTATQATKDAEDAQKRMDDLLSKDIGTDLAAGFDEASKSLGTFVQTFAKLIDEQAKFDEAKKTAGSDPAKQMALAQKEARMQINTYAAMTGAAKGFFKEGSKGYKGLAAAEKTFRAFEMAMSIKTAMEKIGLLEAITVAKVAGDATQVASATASVAPDVAASMAKGEAAALAGVANQAAGDPYTAWARMAMMAAAMAALGFAVAGGSGSGGGAAPTNTGTGTVLGDASAQSESLKNSIDLLNEVDTMTMKYSAGMLTALQSIGSKIGGVTNVLLRDGTINTGSNFNVSEFVQKNVGDPLANFLGISPIMDLGAQLFNAIGLGGLVSGLQGLWGKTSQEITGAGVNIKGSMADVTAGRGMQQYADVQTKKKSWFGLSKSTSTSTQYAALNADIARQFGLIMSGMADAVKAAAEPLGMSLSGVAQRISTFVVDIGRVDFKGLTGDQLQERLSAVFGAQGDKLAAYVLPGLEGFQKVGEGYLETVVRVASAAEVARATLDRLGVSAVALSTLADKQGDIGAELVRRSIVEAETGRKVFADGAVIEWLTSIGQIMSTLTGTGEELAAAYTSLVDVSTTLQGIGVDGSALNRSLILGAGGLDELTSSLSSFESNFLNDTEKLAIQTARMTDQFDRLGLTLPATSADFVGLVRGLDTSTEAGQELLGRVLALSDGYKTLADAQEAAAEATGAATAAARTAADIAQERTNLERQWLEATGNTAAIRALDLSALDESNRALQQRIWALQDETKATEAIASAGKGISAYIDELRGKTGGTASIAKLRATYGSTMDLARSGNVEASGQVVSDAKALMDAVRATASGPLDVARESARIATQLAALPAVRSYEQQQADALSTAISPLMDPLQIIAAATQATASAVAGASAPASLSSGIYTVAQQQAEADAAAQARQQAGGAGEITRVRAFAAGGMHSGGLRLVGEDGPELEVTGPSRIYNAEQTLQMLSASSSSPASTDVSGLLDELRALREQNAAMSIELSGLRDDQRAQAAAIAGSTGRTARILANLTQDGEALSVREIDPVLPATTP